MKPDRRARIIRAMKQATRLWIDGIITTDTFYTRWDALYAAAYDLKRSLEPI